MAILELQNLSFSYHTKAAARDRKKILNDLSGSFEAGKIYAIVGKSGAGKTTLLSLLSGLAAPTGGKILFEGTDISTINRYDLRRKYVGVVFQSYNLLTNLNAVENITLSMDVAGLKATDKKARANELLDQVGLEEEDRSRKILELSGGQQQRVAIARAICYDPKLILADEPTGNLDGETQDEILKILRALADNGKCIIVVTHSPQVAKQADVVIELKKAQKEESPAPKKKTAKPAAAAV